MTKSNYAIDCIDLPKKKKTFLIKTANETCPISEGFQLLLYQINLDFFFHHKMLVKAVKEYLGMTELFWELLSGE